MADDADELDDVDDLFDDAFGADLTARDTAERDERHPVKVTLQEAHYIAKALRQEAIYFEIHCNHGKGKELRALADRIVDDLTTSWF